jgi:hypothetical protein
MIIEYEFLPYVDIVICFGPYLIPGHLYIEARRGRCRADWKQARLNTQVYFRHIPISTNFTFEFIWRPISPILSPSSRTFVELTPRQLASVVVAIVEVMVVVWDGGTTDEKEDMQKHEQQLREHWRRGTDRRWHRQMRRRAARTS